VSVPNPFVDPNTGKSEADQGQRQNGGRGGTVMPINPATTEGIPVMSPSRFASLDILSYG
jgi:hypothetical protein